MDFGGTEYWDMENGNEVAVGLEFNGISLKQHTFLGGRNLVACKHTTWFHQPQTPGFLSPQFPNSAELQFKHVKALGASETKFRFKIDS